MFKKGSKGKLCPVSLGLAVGITCGFGMLLWGFWLLYFGSLPIMTAYPFPTPGGRELILGLIWGFLRGFVFGFFVALFYDLIICGCGRKGCGCNKEGCCCNDKGGECCRREGDAKVCSHTSDVDKTSSLR